VSWRGGDEGALAGGDFLDFFTIGCG